MKDSKEQAERLALQIYDWLEHGRMNQAHETLGALLEVSKAAQVYDRDFGKPSEGSRQRHEQYNRITDALTKLRAKLGPDFEL